VKTLLNKPKIYNNNLQLITGDMDLTSLWCPDFRYVIEKLSVPRRRFSHFIFAFCHWLKYENAELWKHAHKFWVFVSDLYQFLPKNIFLYAEISHEST